MKKFALVFPGQGSQYLTMLNDIAVQIDVINQTFAEASDVLGYDLWQLCQQGPEEKLNQTAYTQPALLTASVALWRVWQAQALPMPTLLAGHSLGEYSALVCAQSIAFADAVRVVRCRGEFMQSAVATGTGSMAAILGLDDAVVQSVCQDAAQGSIVSAANFNSPGQIVIAGERAAVARASELAKQAGAKRVLPLNVSVPSHCALMQPAAKELAEVLKDISIQTPRLPVINNVAARIETAPEKIRQALIEQLTQPVQWTRSVERMVEEGVAVTIECGPGKVLCGLNKRINAELVNLPWHTLDDRELVLTAMDF